MNKKISSNFVKKCNCRKNIIFLLKIVLIFFIEYLITVRIVERKNKVSQGIFRIKTPAII